MDVLMVYPKNNQQLTALKSVMKAMKMPFEQISNVHPSHVTNGVKLAIKQSEEGQLPPYKGIKDMLDIL